MKFETQLQQSRMKLKNLYPRNPLNVIEEERGLKLLALLSHEKTLNSIKSLKNEYVFYECCYTGACVNHGEIIYPYCKTTKTIIYRKGKGISEKSVFRVYREIGSIKINFFSS